MEYDFLTWLGHASFLIKSGKLSIFVDPFRVGEIEEKADIIFITHPHRDHFSEEDIQRISKADTYFVGPQEALEKISSNNIRVVRPGDRGEVLGIAYEAIASYNVRKERQNFHKKESNWVGYVINVEGKKIYHPGDTDLIEEMKGVNVDLALIPCGGKYAMDIDEAIAATKVIHAKNFAPMHYRALLGEKGSRMLEDKFTKNVKGAIILREKGTVRYSF